MAASIKISELNSLTNLTGVDLFLVSDMETGTSRKISYTNLKDNILLDTSSALTDLVNVVTQNHNVSLGNTESVKDRLVVLETDPVTKTYVDGSISDVELVVTQNTTDISALQTTVSNLNIDIAPETLNSINELAGALGDNPQIITNLQSELTDYIAHIEARNLEASLAEGYLYADTLFGG